MLLDDRRDALPHLRQQLRRKHAGQLDVAVFLKCLHLTLGNVVRSLQLLLQPGAQLAHVSHLEIADMGQIIAQPRRMGPRVAFRCRPWAVQTCGRQAGSSSPARLNSRVPAVTPPAQ